MPPEAALDAELLALSGAQLDRMTRDDGWRMLSVGRQLERLHFLSDALLQALRPLFAPAFTLWGAPASWLELIALVLSLVMVALNMRVNPLAWPLARR